jgi:hypothetical protein
MRVKILLAVPDEKSYGPCTMVLDTIRVGYPNAFVDVYLNEGWRGNIGERVRKRCADADCSFYSPGSISHADWIRGILVGHASQVGDAEPLVLLDGDVGFHSSCENWQFDKTFFAGYFTPDLYSDFTDCRSFARLHTSHLWCLDVATMWRGIDKNFPANSRPRADLCPLDLISPSVKFIGGVPYFWDCCCGLYQMYGGTAFGAEHLECYEHLTTSSAFELKKKFAENPQATEWLHTVGYKDLPRLKGILWEAQNLYYQAKAKQLQ